MFCKYCPECILRKSCFPECFLYRKRTLRDIACMLEHCSVPCQQCRDCKSQYLPERKVPRHYCKYHAKRLEDDSSFSFININDLIFEPFFSILAIDIASPCAFFDLNNRIFYGLSHFLRHESPVSFLVFSQHSWEFPEIRYPLLYVQLSPDEECCVTIIKNIQDFFTKHILEFPDCFTCCRIYCLYHIVPL